MWWHTAAFSHTPHSYSWVLSLKAEAATLSSQPSLLHLPKKKLLSRRRFCDVPDPGVKAFVSGQCHWCGRCTDPSDSATCLGDVPLGTIWKKPWDACRQDKVSVVFACIWVVMQPSIPEPHTALNETICLCSGKNKKGVFWDCHGR